MYLKSVEIVGFKSFAEKTRLEFEPGMTAIVGPNGCGKSNVSDAIRWVLGESRARALRGSTMEDCIFNGADSHKPLGMAEVTLTLGDCEQTLDLGLNEISITRRVFRTGESDYFINKKACRRKDIQRLFMDTGVGTNSYSIMEQGKIDQILSSRPDDRRAVFEEASGITKYKNDKKEALRKLGQTEANLLRLTDVIGEVKRQILSLQRQANKAQRFKTLQTDLRKLDLFVSHNRLAELDGRIADIREQLESFRLRVDETHRALETATQSTSSLRTELQTLEQFIGAAMDESMHAKNELERARQTIHANAERVIELDALARQSTKESESALEHLHSHQHVLDELVQQIATAQTEQATAHHDLEQALERQRFTETNVQQGRDQLNHLRGEAMQLDSRIGQLQNELSEIDAKERANVIRKEQLTTEKTSLERALASYNKRRDQMAEQIKNLQQAVATQQEMLEEMREKRTSFAEQIQTLDRETAEINRQLADKNARLEMVFDAREEGFPAGARHLLDRKDGHVIGPLAEQFTAAPEFATALEAVLRPWMDALVVHRQVDARNLLTLIAENEHGAVRLLAAEGDAPAAPTNALLHKISCADEVRPLAARLLANVQLADNLQAIPHSLPANTLFVTPRGELLRADGCAELWKPEEGEANPLARHHLREQLQTDIQQLEKEQTERRDRHNLIRAEQTQADHTMEALREELDARRRALAVQEGEALVIGRELQTTAERAKSVSLELEALLRTQGTGIDQRSTVAREGTKARERLAQIRLGISQQAEELNALEEQRADVLAASSECRVQHTQREQRLESLHSRRQPIEARLHELREVIEQRTRGINSYQQRIAQLKQTRADAESQLDTLQTAVTAADNKLMEARQVRERKTVSLTEHEQSLRTLQHQLEELQNGKTRFEVELAEQRMRHQNTLERVTTTWNIPPEELAREPEPEWEGERPSLEDLEKQIAQYRSKLDAMGPVNLVAIEEHAELEERFTFLNHQEADLTQAKTQLVELIKKINETTTALFKETFDKVNANFIDMFNQLFGGGSAKLVLVDEDDVLESGIEIIAKPPGKKLQTISLLSGGERTMTAVALLFSLFKVKPSPFCVLDELDAALDEANVTRFVTTVQNFLINSQFILITHSRQTIAAADVIYGVTMPSRGVSRTMSMKFSDYHDSESAQE